MSALEANTKKARGLARFLNIPGGITMAEAHERGCEKLESLRARCIADMDDSLSSIGGYLNLFSGEPPGAVRQELHRLSCCVLSLAGTFERDALSKAAYSLCRLLDGTDAPGHWDREAVDVHFSAMRLLFKPDRISPKAQAYLIDGLNKVSTQAKAGNP